MTLFDVRGMMLDDVKIGEEEDFSGKRSMINI